MQRSEHGVARGLPRGAPRWSSTLPPREFRRRRQRQARLRAFFWHMALALTLGCTCGAVLRLPQGPAGSSLPHPFAALTISDSADQRQQGAAAGSPRLAPDSGLEQELMQHLPQANGLLAIYALNLQTGQEVALNADQRMTAASLFKVPVMVEVFRQQRLRRINWEQTMVVRPEHIVPGTGILGGSLGRRITVRELVHLMMSVSDNVAAVMLMDLVGRESINASARTLGLRETFVHTYTRNDPLEPDEDNTTSARDLGLLLQRMAQGELIDRTSSNEMIEFLFKERVHDWMRRELPPYVQVAHKIGSLPNVRNDAGIIFAPGTRIVLVVLTDSVRDQELAEATISRVAAVVLEYFQRRVAT